MRAVACGMGGRATCVLGVGQFSSDSQRLAIAPGGRERVQETTTATRVALSGPLVGRRLAQQRYWKLDSKMYEPRLAFFCSLWDSTSNSI